jgi:hypothetical protein
MSVTHRAFDAIKAESELTCRFNAITTPEWSIDDLSKIPLKGFAALRIDCDNARIRQLALEAQESPFLMQKFCWEICYDMGVDLPPLKQLAAPKTHNLQEMFVRIAKEEIGSWAAKPKGTDETTTPHRRDSGRVQSHINGYSGNGSTGLDFIRREAR